jgi:putative addiction module antidote
VGRLNFPRGSRLYLDTVPIIYTVEEHDVYWTELQPIWTAFAAGEVQIVTSEISLLETLVQIGEAFLLTQYYNVYYNESMTTTLKITTIGSSVGVVLPKDILSRLRVEKGDTLYATETPDGIELRAYDAEFAEDMAIAEKVMRENRDLLRKLAE